MEKLITRIMAIAGIIVLAFNGVDYIRKTPMETSAGIEKRLDDRISSEILDVREEMSQRRAERDKEIAAIKKEIQASAKVLMDKLEKMDDRLFELQKHQREARIRAGEVLVEDI